MKHVDPIAAVKGSGINAGTKVSVILRVDSLGPGSRQLGSVMGPQRPGKFSTRQGMKHRSPPGGHALAEGRFFYGGHGEKLPGAADFHHENPGEYVIPPPGLAGP
jgi:hypothetical protein